MSGRKFLYSSFFFSYLENSRSVVGNECSGGKKSLKFRHVASRVGVPPVPPKTSIFCYRDKEKFERCLPLTLCSQRVRDIKYLVTLCTEPFVVS